MHISLVGINHRTAPVAIREKAAIRAGNLKEALLLLRSYAGHGVILSTCNRTEVYTTGSDSESALKTSLGFLESYLEMSSASLQRYTYSCLDEAAMQHLFRIACGLDSMVVGEHEILGQVGNALEAAEEAETVDLALRRLFQSAIGTGRRVREETGISRNCLSVSSVAVDLALKAIGDPVSCKMIVIGAGEAGRLVVKAAKDRGINRIFVASRSKAKASSLANELGGVGFSLNSLAEELGTANMVVACAAAPHWVLRVDHVETAMRNRNGSPLVLFDIAVPRNVEPAVKDMRNILLYNIDDLTQICDSNRKLREGEIKKAEEIIASEVTDFISWWQTLDVRPLVSALMSKAEAIRQEQLNKTLKKLRPLSDDEKADLEAMTKSIVTKILQGHIQYFNNNGGHRKDLVPIVSELFQLETRK